MHIRTKYGATVGWVVLWVWFHLCPEKYRCDPGPSTCLPIYVLGCMWILLFAVKTDKKKIHSQVYMVGGTVKSNSRRRTLKRIILYDSPIYFLSLPAKTEAFYLLYALENCCVNHSQRTVFSIRWTIAALLRSLLSENDLLHSLEHCWIPMFIALKELSSPCSTWGSELKKPLGWGQNVF